VVTLVELRGDIFIKSVELLIPKFNVLPCPKLLSNFIGDLNKDILDCVVLKALENIGISTTDRVGLPGVEVLNRFTKFTLLLLLK
jgi:hypothetical protein